MESPLPLFKLGAHEKLKTLSGNKSVECSVKYQVLSKETAMVCVVKQRNKATGEMEKHELIMADRIKVAAQSLDSY